MNKRPLKVLLIVLIMLILMCLIYLGYVLYGYFKADHEYITVKDLYVETGDDSEEETPEEAVKGYTSLIPYRDIDIDGLLEANPDFVFWLYYEDGKVDYPVVKEREDAINEYLHKTFEGQPSTSGCLFIPYDASDDLTDLNTFVYGHNMRNGSMFGSLKLIYRDPVNKYKDPYFYVWTKDHEQIMYRVISMYVVDKNSNMYAVPTDSTNYGGYLSAVLQNGSMERLIPFTMEDECAMDEMSPIMTFSVCYGAAGTSNRLLVHGIEILREPYVKQ